MQLHCFEMFTEKKLQILRKMHAVNATNYFAEKDETKYGLITQRFKRCYQRFKLQSAHDKFTLIFSR